MLHKAAAIETVVARVAAVTIGRVGETQRIKCDLMHMPGLYLHGVCIPGMSLLRDAGGCGAGAEQQDEQGKAEALHGVKFTANLHGLQRDIFMKNILASLALLFCAPVWAELEIIALRHRSAEEVLPVFVPCWARAMPPVA